MNLFFTIFLIALGVGGGLAIIFKFEEYDKKAIIGFLFLLSLMGLVTAIWGVFLHLNHSYIYSIGKGQITGLQLILIGILSTIFSVYLGIMEFKKNKKI